MYRTCILKHLAELGESKETPEILAHARRILEVRINAMQRPRKAVVLAAGFGTRMLPLSLDLPKPMMPLWGKPLLGHILDLLASWGVAEALVNLHHDPDAIVRHLSRRSPARPRICLSFEPEILGTGGALRKAEWFLDDEPFWMINADIAADLDPLPLLQSFARHRPLAALWLHPDLGPRTVEMTGGMVTGFSSSRPGTRDTFTFCGLQLLSPRILDYLPPHGFHTIVQAYERALADGHAVRGVCAPKSFWADMGTPDNYLGAHAEVLKRFRRGEPGWRLFDPAQLRKATALRKSGVQIGGIAAIGHNVRIDPGAAIVNSVIWDGAHIAANAVVENAVVGTGSTARGRVPRVAVRSDFTMGTAGRLFDAHLALALDRLGWNPAETTVIAFEARGSARIFSRLEHAGRSVIMIRYSLEREENALYAQHARFLKELGMGVPEIVLDFPRRQFLVMQDLGDQSLQVLARQAEARRTAAWYRQILREVAVLHERGTRLARQKKLRLVAPFSPDLYRWEREFFANHFLRRRLELDDGEVSGILDELGGAAAALGRAPAALVHRDLQSSNILLFRGHPCFIDFQGMRFGAAAYDLASLLCDPYVELPVAHQIELLDFYNRLLPAARRIDGQDFWLAAIQRLAQALGAYGRLSANPETARFARYIPPGLRMLRRALARTGGFTRLTRTLDKAIDNATSSKDNHVHALPSA